MARLQQTFGNRAVQRLLKSRAIQPKLTVSQPGDFHEQEADRVADAVMRIPEGTTIAASNGSSELLQKKCAGCASGKSLCPTCAADEKNLQRKPMPITPLRRQAARKEGSGIAEALDEEVAATGTRDVEADIDSFKGGGEPLPDTVRTFFEPRFGYDFGQVRVHTDSRAAESARTINALAYTVGRDVVLGAGQYAPETNEGKRLLAHELTHVVQQGEGATRKSEGSMPPAQNLPRMVQGFWPEVIGGAIGGIVGGVGGFLVGGPVGAAVGAVGGAAVGAGIGHLAAGCDTANKAERRTACIQPVVIANDDGTAPTTAPSMAKSQSIWEKCCISYSVKPTQTVNKTSFKTLDESPTNVPTVEESALFTAAGASTCVQVFVPENFEQGGRVGKDISGGGGTYDSGTANPKVVVVEGSDPAVVAHEVGHASGHAGHDVNTTVMKPTGAYNVANSSKVSIPVCNAARTGAVLSAPAGKDDCCMSPG